MNGNYCEWCGKKLHKKSTNDPEKLVIQDISICQNENCSFYGIEQVEERHYLNISNAMRLSKLTIGVSNEKEQIE